VPGTPTAPDLAVLLSTSGSTGSPKLVRLSRENIRSNAQAIASSLALRPQDRAVTSLPLFYSFGMSLITSHMMAGSSVLVTNRSVLEREFWANADDGGVTHLAGVPQTYAMLKRLGFSSMELPHLRGLLQAGGRLDPRLIAEFSADAADRGRQFFVMYGQTEAAPRMACLPPERLPEKIGSAGLALEGGRFKILDESGVALEAGKQGEIVYSGPNVMMGYAEVREDLTRGDDTGGELHTGDLGHLDDEGFLFITGRTKRIAKIAGARVSLDEVEAMLDSLSAVAAVATSEDGIAVFTTTNDRAKIDAARRRLSHDLGAPFSLLRFVAVDELPLLSSGKVDYARLSELGGGR
jgi:acyl-CoA synthetase (AMP-forming)/AMP-acid ligase II